MRRALYAMFDGDEFGGEFYNKGDEVTVDLDEGTVDVLIGLGRLSSTKPAPNSAMLPLGPKAIADMSRAELEAAALEAVTARMTSASDDQLREAIQRHREEQGIEEPGSRADSGTGEDGSKDGDGAASYEDLKDKPLSQLRTAELSIVAEHEGVDLSEASNNGERVKAIEAKRAG